jgi:hypothetical protein
MHSESARLLYESTVNCLRGPCCPLSVVLSAALEVYFHPARPVQRCWPTTCQIPMDLHAGSDHGLKVTPIKGTVQMCPLSSWAAGRLQRGTASCSRGEANCYCNTSERRCCSDRSSTGTDTNCSPDCRSRQSQFFVKDDGGAQKEPGEDRVSRAIHSADELATEPPNLLTHCNPRPRSSRGLVSSSALPIAAATLGLVFYHPTEALPTFDALDLDLPSTRG